MVFASVGLAMVSTIWTFQAKPSNTCSSLLNLRRGLSLIFTSNRLIKARKEHLTSNGRQETEILELNIVIQIQTLLSPRNSTMTWNTLVNNSDIEVYNAGVCPHGSL
ncbi:hypothetical protein YC2023_087185 [Brassica napus]